MATMPAQLSYSVPPHEQAYYEALFQMADISRANVISGAEAVAFFSRSKLTVETLKSIWMISDMPVANCLDRRKFAIAVRLIQLAQNGVKAQGPQLQGPSGLKAPFFEGVPLPEPVPDPTSNVGPPSNPQYTPQQPQVAAIPQQNIQQYHPQQHLQAPPTPPRTQPPSQQPLANQPPQHQHDSMSPSRAGIGGYRPPMPPTGVPPPAFSMALTPQDPFTMNPQEQARYEDLFPNYCGQDGFVHGKEALDLFSKSNLSKEILGNIWTMVDFPVDNKLDKLEFAIAMHLIVCITRKNLPPPNSLPMSLKILKSQQPTNTTTFKPTTQTESLQNALPSQEIRVQQPERTPTPSFQQPQPMQQFPGPSSFQQPPSMQQFSGPPPLQQPAPTQQFSGPPPLQQPAPTQQFSGLPPLQQPAPTQQFSGPPPLQQPPPTLQFSGPPPLQQYSGPPPLQQQPSYRAPTPIQQQASVPSSPQPRYHTPPPLPSQGSGTMAITDAFEGLNPVTAAQGYTEPTNYDNMPPTLPSMGFNSLNSSQEPVVETITERGQLQSAYIPPAPVPPPQSTEQLAASYKMGDDSDELKKLKATLQRLQAENIALKAQMGSMTEEERSVQKEAAATISEIARLSSELSEVRAQVLSTKSRLMESTAELTAAKEKKAVLTDLISEAKVTKEVMESVTHDLSSVNEKLHTTSAPAPVAEADLFSWGNSHNTEELPTQGNFSWDNNAPSVETAFSGSDDHYLPPIQQFSQQVNISSSYDSRDIPAGHVENNPVSTNHILTLDPLSAMTVITKEEVEKAKQTALAADSNARQLNETFLALSAETETLRKAADAAEATHLAKQEKAAKKMMGKKKSLKEAEDLAVEAASKRKHYLEMQAQTMNAQKIAEDSRKEAEKVRVRAEQMEIDFASAESTKISDPPQAHSAVTRTAASTMSQYGDSTHEQNSTGQFNAPQQPYVSYGISQSNASPAFDNVQGYGNGGPSLAYPKSSEDSFTFGGGIMGGGSGIDIPVPTSNDYNYDNPF